MHSVVFERKTPADGTAKPLACGRYFNKVSSVTQFTDLVLDQPSGGAGQLVHAANAGHVLAVNLCGGTGAAVSATPAASS